MIFIKSAFFVRTTLWNRFFVDFDAPGVLLEPFWHPSWLSWPLLGIIWALLGRSWDALGPSWGGSWDALGRSWESFGPLKGSPGTLEPHFGAPELDFRCFTAVFPCVAPRIIRTTLARGGMCAALGMSGTLSRFYWCFPSGNCSFWLAQAHGH